MRVEPEPRRRFREHFDLNFRDSTSAFGIFWQKFVRFPGRSIRVLIGALPGSRSLPRHLTHRWCCTQTFRQPVCTWCWQSAVAKSLSHDSPGLRLTATHSHSARRIGRTLRLQRPRSRSGGRSNHQQPAAVAAGDEAQDEADRPVLSAARSASGPIPLLHIPCAAPLLLLCAPAALAMRRLIVRLVLALAHCAPPPLHTG